MATYLLWGAPSNGKSYYATLIAILEMLSGRKVFSSYPIIYTMPLTIFQLIKNLIYRIYNLIQWYLLFKVHHNLYWYKPIELIKNRVYSTYKWEHKYIDAGLLDCCIIIDEGYLEFNCHDKLPVVEHTFFATSGHNNNDIYVIAQNYSRINLAIRELANYFIYVYKFSNPFSKQSKTGRKQLTPLFFTVETYIKEEDFRIRNINPKVIWEKKRVWFKRSIANAYDTQYYRLTQKIIHPVLWINALKQKKEQKQDINPISANLDYLADVFPEVLRVEF